MQEKVYNIAMNKGALEAIVVALSHLPYKDAAKLISGIVIQRTQQDQADKYKVADNKLAVVKEGPVAEIKKRKK